MTLESSEPRVEEKEATLVSPLGGALVDLLMTADELADLSARAEELISLRVFGNGIRDLALLGNGAYSPLDGFQGRRDYESVVAHAALGDGLPGRCRSRCPRGTSAFAPGRRRRRGCARGRSVLGALTVTEIYDRDLEPRLARCTGPPTRPSRRRRTVRAGTDGCRRPGSRRRAGPRDVPSAPAETRAALADRGVSTSSDSRRATPCIARTST